MKAGTMKAPYVGPNASESGDAAIPSAITAPPTTTSSTLIERLASMFAFHHTWSIVPSPPVMRASDAEPGLLGCA
jgi:hypothetical protein